MHALQDGWDVAWAVFMVVFWVAVIAAGTYAAVKLVTRPPGGRHA